MTMRTGKERNIKTILVPGTRAANFPTLGPDKSTLISSIAPVTASARVPRRSRRTLHRRCPLTVPSRHDQSEAVSASEIRTDIESADLT